MNAIMNVNPKDGFRWNLTWFCFSNKTSLNDTIVKIVANLNLMTIGGPPAGPVCDCKMNRPGKQQGSGGRVVIQRAWCTAKSWYRVTAGQLSFLCVVLQVFLSFFNQWTTQIIWGEMRVFRFGEGVTWLFGLRWAFFELDKVWRDYL